MARRCGLVGGLVGRAMSLGVGFEVSQLALSLSPPCRSGARFCCCKLSTVRYPVSH